MKKKMKILIWYSLAEKIKPKKPSNLNISNKHSEEAPEKPELSSLNLIPLRNSLIKFEQEQKKYEKIELLNLYDKSAKKV